MGCRSWTICAEVNLVLGLIIGVVAASSVSSAFDMVGIRIEVLMASVVVRMEDNRARLFMMGDVDVDVDVDVGSMAFRQLVGSRSSLEVM